MQYSSIFTSIAVASSLLATPAASQQSADSSIISAQVTSLKTVAKAAHTASATKVDAQATGTATTDCNTPGTNSSSADGNCLAAKSPSLASGVVVATGGSAAGNGSASLTSSNSTSSPNTTSTTNSTSTSSSTPITITSAAAAAMTPVKAANLGGSKLELISNGKPLSLLGLLATGFFLYA